MEIQRQKPPPISLRLKPVYESGLKNIAEREGVTLHAILVRAIEEWAQAYSRNEAAAVSERLRTTEEGKDILAFGDAALIDMATMEERVAVRRAKA